MSEQMPFNDDYDSNTSGNAEFLDLFNKTISRRELITKTAGGAVAITLATTLTGCSDDNDSASIVDDSVFDESKLPSSLQFKAVDKNTLNKELFEKDPVKAIEKVLGVDLPDDKIEAVVEGVKAKIKVDAVSDIAGKFKKLC